MSSRESRQEHPELTKEQRLQIFKRIEELVRESLEKIAKPIEIDSRGMVNFEQMVSLMSSQPSIEIGQLKDGDVAWWIDREASNYYYQQTASGFGVLRIVDREGNEVIQEEVRISGATLGTSIWVRRVARNLLVEYTLPPKIRTSGNRELGEKLESGVPLVDLQHRGQLTSEISSMGIIRREIIDGLN